MFHLPTDLITHIFEYDNTYREVYNNVMNNLFENIYYNVSMIKILKSIKFDILNIKDLDFGDFAFIIERLINMLFENKCFDVDKIYFYRNIKMIIEEYENKYYIHFSVDYDDICICFKILDKNQENKEFNLSHIMTYKNRYKIYSETDFD